MGHGDIKPTENLMFSYIIQPDIACVFMGLLITMHLHYSRI
ncbi:MAG: hypothetical protein HRT51_19820 [Colwellia sp.]|nr:hypothetical protein [Colwellia sp.]